MGRPKKDAKPSQKDVRGFSMKTRSTNTGFLLYFLPLLDGAFILSKPETLSEPDPESEPELHSEKKCLQVLTVRTAVLISVRNSLYE